MKATLVALALMLAPLPLAAQDGTDSGTIHRSGDSLDASHAFARADRPLGFKLGYAGPDRGINLGVQVDAILLNRIGVEFSTTVRITTIRARYYLLAGPLSPFVGIGTGISFLEGGRWTGSWKEAHAGLERSFPNGFVLQFQMLGFFDRRGAIGQSYAFAPGLGYRF